ncbi:MAG: ABC transporter permease subunit [Opitutae bacterium]|nr:ABC transporter permease subunit [Opitutae bacterium]MBC9888301.1 ABC transporter permease subunit [Opitutae bacterium]
MNRRRQGRRLLRRFIPVGLALPLVAFVLVTFVIPLATMVVQSVHDPEVADAFPRTLALLADWEDSALPSPDVYEAMAAELVLSRENRSIGKVATRVNRIESGTRSVFAKTARRLESADTSDMPASMIQIDRRWGDVSLWRAIVKAGQRYTARHYLQSIDLERGLDGEIQLVSEERRIYKTLYLRTVYVSFAVTVSCFLIGYPIAFAITSVSDSLAKILLVIVLVPFWTSLLVRTTSWLVLLQNQGVINDILVWIGLVDDGSRLALVHNMTGTLIAMTHVLLPFMILPLYAVMRSIPPVYMRAAASLGANPFQAFARVYFPQSLPGVSAGCLLVFILSLGYYITPALVGGAKGQLISNMIAYHIQTSLNWGLAAAISVVVLVGVFVCYFLFDRWVGIDKLKLG